MEAFYVDVVVRGRVDRFSLLVLSHGHVEEGIAAFSGFLECGCVCDAAGNPCDAQIGRIGRIGQIIEGGRFEVEDAEVEMRREFGEDEGGYVAGTSYDQHIFDFRFSIFDL